MLWPKKNSYKEFDNEKKFLRLENSPPPPISFLMVRPLAKPLPKYAKSILPVDTRLSKSPFPGLPNDIH